MARQGRVFGEAGKEVMCSGKPRASCGGGGRELSADPGQRCPHVPLTAGTGAAGGRERGIGREEWRSLMEEGEEKRIYIRGGGE